MLLTRSAFRNAVFERDGHKCVICGDPAQDAHHIMERRLWPDGGYYLDNGASVCGECHLEAEATTFSCSYIRQEAGIDNVVLPPHLYDDQEYDKWANPILPNGTRLKGELFHDASVQKVIAPALSFFTDRVKYPRTYHLPWSPGGTSDDRKMESISAFEDEDVIVTVKMDGEQTTMYRDGFHARSINSPSHPSRDWLWGLHRKIGHEIPEGWRLCGENLYAKHSIHYKGLPAHFMLFSVWNENNEALTWEDTQIWGELLGISVVDTLYMGPWNEDAIRELNPIEHRGNPCEGYVVRVERSFRYREFPKVVGKYVRKDHVHTHGHWMREGVVMNELDTKEGA